jgi:hypothetical protein
MAKIVYAYLETGIRFEIPDNMDENSQETHNMIRAHFQDMIASQEPIEFQIEVEEE